MTKGNLDLNADDRDLMEIWHEQTRNYRGAMGRRARIIDQYMTDPAAIRRATAGWPLMAGDKVLQLPAPQGVSAELAEVCRARRSTPRGEIGGTISLAALSNVLGMAVASTRHRPSSLVPEAIVSFRPYPSAGALFPCEIFIIAGAINGLPPQPLRYDARNHTLIDFGCPRGRFQSMETVPDLQTPPCAVVIAGVLDRTTAKYGPRGYRFACLEAGHLGQNILLAAAAAGLSCLTYGSYYDYEIEKWLDLDGLNEVVLSVILLGGAEEQSAQVFNTQGST
ncbi:SagB/ThcOx family dehydrogenase [Asticcacaulis sp.]|uniref:SagB/ThcOx family dehydrogenase n=1 Tax=Asticcacaulis sp. TaxID=1872648 RepID=UPI003F7CBCC4